MNFETLVLFLRISPSLTVGALARDWVAFLLRVGSRFC